MEDLPKQEVALKDPNPNENSTAPPNENSTTPDATVTRRTLSYENFNNYATPSNGNLNNFSSDAFVEHSELFPVNYQVSNNAFSFDYYQNNPFPPGYKFKPYDHELVVYYLQKKISNEALPPNKIRDVVLYQHNPEDLAAKYAQDGENEWYFFTPRDRKYPNGERPNRAAGDGYWKATGADKPVYSGDDKVGFRKALVFYKGRPPKGDKTDWIMHEYRVNNQSPRQKKAGDMKLDDWVLCRIYKKYGKSNRAPSRIRNQTTDQACHLSRTDQAYHLSRNGGNLKPQSGANYNNDNFKSHSGANYNNLQWNEEGTNFDSGINFPFPISDSYDLGFDHTYFGYENPVPLLAPVPSKFPFQMMPHQDEISVGFTNIPMPEGISDIPGETISGFSGECNIDDTMK